MSDPLRNPALAPRAVHVGRVLRALVALVALTLLAPLSATPAIAAPPSTVDVIDASHALTDPSALEKRLEQVSFRKDVHLVALTLDVRTLDIDPADEKSLNDGVLAYARAHHQDWLAGSTWADGLVLIAIDPHGRKLGSYAGEDVKLSDSRFSAVQDAMRDAAKKGAWADAFADGTQKYADLLGRPWWQSPGVLIAAVVGAVLLITTAAGTLWSARTTQRRVDRALERLEDVRAQSVRTERAAQRIPRDSLYGRAVLDDVDDYRKDVRAAEKLAAQVPDRHGIRWGVTSGAAPLSRRLETKVNAADNADDRIITAADLLTRAGSWREAWTAERKPLDDSLAAVDETIAKAKHTNPATAEHLRTEAELIARDLDDVSRSYADGRLDPDAALDQLDQLTERLGFAAAGLREDWIAAEAKGAKEERVMRKATPKAFTREFDSTVRAHRVRRHPEAYTADFSLSPILWTLLWMPRANSALDEHRHPTPSTSGSVSGYSGTSFTGAGSSSSF